MVDEEQVEVGHLDAAASQRLLQIAPIKRKEQLGAAGDGQGADVGVSRISRQRCKVQAIANLDRIDPTFWKLAPHMADPCLGRLIREFLLPDKSRLGLVEQGIASDQIEEPRADRETTNQLVKHPREDDVRVEDGASSSPKQGAERARHEQAMRRLQLAGRSLGRDTQADRTRNLGRSLGIGR